MFTPASMLSSTSMVTQSRSHVLRTVISPPSGVKRKALDNRFMKINSILSASTVSGALPL